MTKSVDLVPRDEKSLGQICSKVRFKAENERIVELYGR